MGHTQHFQCAVYASNGCMGFYRHESEIEALMAAAEALSKGQFALHFPVIKAFPPCPPEIKAAAQAEAQAQAAQFEAQGMANIEAHDWDFEDDIPW